MEDGSEEPLLLALVCGEERLPRCLNVHVAPAMPGQQQVVNQMPRLGIYWDK